MVQYFYNMNMNLDDLQLIKVLDSTRMIDVIHSQPEQVKISREMGKKLSLSLKIPVDRTILGTNGTACLDAQLQTRFLAQSSPVDISTPVIDEIRF